MREKSLVLHSFIFKKGRIRQIHLCSRSPSCADFLFYFSSRPSITTEPMATSSGPAAEPATTEPPPLVSLPLFPEPTMPAAPWDSRWRVMPCLASVDGSCTCSKHLGQRKLSPPRPTSLTFEIFPHRVHFDDIALEPILRLRSIRWMCVMRPSAVGVDMDSGIAPNCKNRWWVRSQKEVCRYLVSTRFTHEGSSRRWCLYVAVLHALRGHSSPWTRRQCLPVVAQFPFVQYQE